MRLLYNILFLFTFFISFVLLNVPSEEWGLQFSWFVAIIIFIVYPFYYQFKYKLIINRNVVLVFRFFMITILLTLLSLLLQYLGIISLNGDGYNGRTLSHTIYLIFDFIVYLHIVMYLQQLLSHNVPVKYFVTFPFYFIVFWGVYQWLTTFGIVGYWDIFNRSLSTGFTYLRFVAEHRSSSVFPEPSEYAYFIAFLLPFVVSKWVKKDMFFFNSKSLYVAIVWLIAFCTCKSMSLILVSPFIVLYAINCNVKLSVRTLVTILIISFSFFTIIVILQFNRVLSLLSGSDGSAIVRFKSFIETYDLFKSSPLIGVGFGAVRGLDLLSFILSTTGVLGLINFIYLILSLRPLTVNNSYFIQGLKCIICVTLISNPVLDHLFFWVVLAFISVPLIRNSENECRLCFDSIQS